MIVVGNGMVSKPQGYLIDKFDTVIRLSRYKIKGYECLIGTKTDIHVVARVENSDPSNKIWIGNPLGLSSTPQKTISEAYPNGYVINNRMQQIYQETGMSDGEHPTLGLLAIFMALEHGKYFYDLPITITALDFMQLDWPSYYYDLTPRKRICPHHNMSKERMVVKELMQKGLVKLLLKEDIINLDDNAPPVICPCIKNSNEKVL